MGPPPTAFTPGLAARAASNGAVSRIEGNGVIEFQGTF
jgi:hypothetical protein